MLLSVRERCLADCGQGCRTVEIAGEEIDSGRGPSALHAAEDGSDRDAAVRRRSGLRHAAESLQGCRHKGVFLFDGRFYQYDNGVWLESKKEDGPWVTTSFKVLPVALRKAVPVPESGQSVRLPSGDTVVYDEATKLFRVENKAGDGSFRRDVLRVSRRQVVFGSRRCCRFSGADADQGPRPGARPGAEKPQKKAARRKTRKNKDKKGAKEKGAKGRKAGGDKHKKAGRNKKAGRIRGRRRREENSACHDRRRITLRPLRPNQAFASGRVLAPVSRENFPACIRAA